MNSLMQSDVALGVLTFALPLVALFVYYSVRKRMLAHDKRIGHWVLSAEPHIVDDIPYLDEIENEPVWLQSLDRVAANAILELAQVPQELQRELGHDLLRRIAEYNRKPRTAG